MARARNIKPGFFTNDRLAECTPFARILFAGLWTIADKEGRLEDRPKKIKAAILPYDNVDCSGLLEELFIGAFITRYSIEGCAYIAINSWGKHQNPHVKEVDSVIPAPYKYSASTVLAEKKPEQARPLTDTLNLIPLSNISTKIKKYEYTEDFDELWRLFPSARKGNKLAAFHAYKRSLTRATKEEIVNGVKAYSETQEAKGPYVKSPEAWLNGDRWAWDYKKIDGGGPGLPRYPQKPNPNPNYKNVINLARKNDSTDPD